MRILRLRAYCEPELVAGSHLTKDMDEAYALHGMTNINYTPMPTRGVTDEVRGAYKHKKHEVLCDGHVIINRFSMFKERKNPIQRAFRYLCCSVCEYYLGTRIFSNLVVILLMFIMICHSSICLLLLAKLFIQKILIMKQL